MVQYVKHSYGVHTLGVTDGSPIFLDGPTNISLNVAQQNILKIARVGDDLIIYLIDGQQILILDFFLEVEGPETNKLFTSTDGEIQEIELGDRYGLFTSAEYKPLEVFDEGLLFDDNFERSLVREPVAAATGNPINLGLIGGGAAGIGLLGALGGGGGSSGGAAAPVAALVAAPDAPIIQVASASVISGTGEPGATVDLDTTGDGVVNLSTTVASNGTWAVTPNPVLADGDLVIARQTDADGNQSIAAADTVDAIAPDALIIQVASASVISGTGEPGATVDLDTTGDGVVNLSTTVASNGTWAVTPNLVLADGAPVTARQTDTDGNQSIATADTVDAAAPGAPIIQVASASVISGTGEPGATVDLDTTGDGMVNLSTTVASNGTWAVTPNPVLADGDLVIARQTDTDGNQSIAAADTVDAVAPDVPIVDVVSDGTQTLGTAEPNVEVSMSYVGATDQIITLNPITVSNTGNWSANPNPSLSDDEDIYVRTSDADGNSSAYTLVLQGTDDGVIDFNNLTGDVAVGVAAFDIEAIDLSDDASNALIITEASLESLSASSDTLRIDGINGNNVTASGASANGNTTINGQLYHVYEFAGGGQITVDQDVHVVI